MSAGELGILGAGQLGRMLALAATPMGIGSCFVGDNQGAMPLGLQLGQSLADGAALQKLAERCRVITFETEHVPAAAQQALARASCRPSLAALYALQQRLRQKRLLTDLRLPTADFDEVNSFDQLHAAAARLGHPFVLKTASNGYDGRGQFVVAEPNQLKIAWQRLGAAAPLLAERFVAFDKEFSLVAARGVDGQIIVYAPTQNLHRQGVLIESTVPAAISLAQQHAARTAIMRLLEALDYVGVMAVEFFAIADDIHINEVAPRVHNSGHWTIDGAVTSQFENHVRAIAGLPLGAPDLRGPTAMHNLIGGLPPLQDLLAIAGARPHFYGKSARPGRKLGHVNVVAPTPELLAERQAQLRRLIAPTLILAER